MCVGEYRFTILSDIINNIHVIINNHHKYSMDKEQSVGGEESGWEEG